LAGHHAWDIDGLWTTLNGIGANHAAKAALDLAIHDAQAKALGISCAALLGGKLRPLPVSWRLSLSSRENMLRDAHEMRERYGFRAFKVKGSADWRHDMVLVRELRRAFGDETGISIDFNQCLSAQELLKALPHLEDAGVELIEEPLPARDGAGKQLCAQRSSIPISGDDSCFTPDDVLHELRLGAVREVVLKIARSGYRPARDIVALARAFHVPLHCGTQGDMHIGTCSAAHFACTYAAEHKHEFSAFLDAADHLGDREPVVRDGCLVLPDGSGIGVAIDEVKLQKYRIDR
jgi:L-alanine-DL-glutamate epimerase-like enolase superfamily enzyme